MSATHSRERLADPKRKPWLQTLRPERQVWKQGLVEPSPTHRQDSKAPGGHRTRGCSLDVQHSASVYKALRMIPGTEGKTCLRLDILLFLLISPLGTSRVILEPGG